MDPRYAEAFRNARDISIWDKSGLIGRFIRWHDGGWVAVILRDEFWKHYL